MFYLMTQFARSPNAWLAYAIVEHLNMLLGHFRADSSRYPVYARLLPVWEALIPEYRIFRNIPITLTQLTSPLAATIH